MIIWLQSCIFNPLGPLSTQQLFKHNSHYLFVSLIYYYINYRIFVVYLKKCPQLGHLSTYYFIYMHISVFTALCVSN